MLKTVMFKAPDHMQTKIYKKSLKKAGSLHKGGVFVAVSSISKNKNMFGLFSKRSFKKGEILTTYGGIYRHRDEMVNRVTSHTRRIPGSDYVLDGFKYSTMFNTYGIQLDTEKKKGIELRTHLIPIQNHSYASSEMNSGGVGYMANTSKKSDINVSIKCIASDKFDLYPCGIFYVANRNIPKNTEIFAPYNNTESLFLVGLNNKSNV